MEHRHEAFEPTEARERPVRPVAPREERYAFEAPEREPYRMDLTRWGPVIAGFFTTLSLVVLLGVLGAAIGLTTGTGALLWGVITLVVAFFAGGWVAGRTAAASYPGMGWLQGALVWSVTTVILLVLSTLGLLGALPNLPAIAPAPGVVDPGVLTAAAWGTFIGLLLGLVAAALGGIFGGQQHERPMAMR